MMTMADRFRTYAALGPVNLLRVATYRYALKAGVHPVRHLAAQVPAGPFFARRSTQPDPAATARKDWQKQGLWFGAHPFDATTPPDWHLNPFSGTRANPSSPWFDLPDFDPMVGDIKGVWEASRFDWLLAMAQRAALGDTAELLRLNEWIRNWAEANPPYRGANWKCGQEASIRVMHLALAALVLDQADRPSDGLVALLQLHLARIAPTMGYAIGQQNNHGTSEAAALFIGGEWLDRAGVAGAGRWSTTGRRWLEERARALIEVDGGFSQYSLVYHRVMLDTYALAESWRRLRGLPAFSANLYERLAAATHWFHQMVDPATGDGPNYGANDGARLMALSNGDYRDFRPSLQWAAALFCDARAIEGQGSWDQPLHWLGFPLPDRILPAPQSETFDDSGLHVLRNGAAVAYLRYPRFRFRPGQADALHCDLWIGGRNILRDAGTYSYNASAEDTACFNGVSAHNSVQFDDRDQMPRLGRFLFGGWLQARDVKHVDTVDGATEASAAYRDIWGSEHDRHLRLTGRELVCTDRLTGTARRAVLRWRLEPGDWQLDGRSITDGRISLSISSDDPSMNVTLTEGWESRHYLERTALPIVEARLAVPATVSTRVRF